MYAVHDLPLIVLVAVAFVLLLQTLPASIMARVGVGLGLELGSGLG